MTASLTTGMTASLTGASLAIHTMAGAGHSTEAEVMAALTEPAEARDD